MVYEWRDADSAARARKARRPADPLSALFDEVVETRPAEPTTVPDVVPKPPVRTAEHVERLTYTRTQAADALGVSATTFARRLLPLIETVEMPWGTQLIPVDELERLVAER